jgi:hypothetical protein
MSDRSGWADHDISVFSQLREQWAGRTLALQDDLANLLHPESGAEQAEWTAALGPSHMDGQAR